jgi:Na+/glutamate symporter
MGMLSVAKREVQHVGGIALYLLLAFGIFATLKKLILASYQIEFSVLLPTVIGAFALAKVVVLLDMTPVAACLDTRYPIWVATVFKALFYCAVSAPVLFTERIWHAYRETGTIGEAVLEAWTRIDLNVALAKVITVGVVFGCYHLYHGIARRLGQDKLWRMISAREERGDGGSVL